MQKQPLTFVHGSSIIQTQPTTSTASMAAESRLDQVVKGDPPSSVKPPPTPPIPNLSASSRQSTPTPDPLSTLPSSPPQIYLNLLILEASLRSQYLHLLARRRLNMFFVLLLTLWNTLFIYLLFLRPREDGTGFGGSVYWVIETTEKVALMGGLVTALLIWGTGQYERGIKWPRRWVGTANRGLRVFNLRVVIVRRAWYREALAYLAFVLPLGLLDRAGASEWHLVEQPRRRDEENAAGAAGELVEEDLGTGGDHVKLLLLPKSFSPEFRENWEEYRAEYWERENERRALLRKQVKTHKRSHAQATGGWKWWSGIWRLYPHVHPRHHQQRGTHSRPNSQLISEKDLLKPSHSHRRPLKRSESSHSRASSRSSTPQIELDGTSEKPLSERTRRGSATGSTRRKSKDKGSQLLGGSARNSIVISPLSRADEGSRPGTPGSESSSATLGSQERTPGLL